MGERALIAGVGQPWMRDLSFGSHVVRYLKGLPAAGPVDTLDLSFNPITGCHLIEDGGYGRVVFVTARAAGRPRGALYERPVELPPLDPDAVHAHIGDAVMGCVSLESLIVVCRYHQVLPGTASIVEVEPEDDHWGPDLSPQVQSLVRPAAELALLRCTG